MKKLPSEIYVMNMTRYCNNPEPMYGGACLISNHDNSTGIEEVKEVICEGQGKKNSVNILDIIIYLKIFFLF